MKVGYQVIASIGGNKATVMDSHRAVRLITLLVLVVIGTFYLFESKFNKNYSQVKLDNFHLEPMEVSPKLQESRGEKTDNFCKDCNRNVPNVVMQYGVHRTATTLQFQILCVMMAMLHENNTNAVGCYFNKEPAHEFSVIKTHNIDFLLKSPQNAWIFMTAKTHGSKDYVKDKQKIEHHNRSVRLTVDAETLSKRGHFVAYEYQSVFGISDTQMSHVVTYLRYWDILRRCCGKEMSMDWRNQLSPIPNYTQHYKPDETAYPACEMYNIGKVEELFIQTFIYKRFISVSSLRNVIGKLSFMDGNLNGHFCELCNKNIIKHRLHRIKDKCT